MQVRLLGPVSAVASGVEIPLGGPKQRAVFALLALTPNKVVSLDRLVYEIWLDEPPARSTLALQSYISRLRRLLGDVAERLGGEPVATAARIVTRPPGWVLEMPAEAVDAVRFSNLVSAGSRLSEAGDPAGAAATLSDALNLWWGDPLADVEGLPFAATEGARLTLQRLSATELLFEAELAAGRPTVVVDDARRFTTEHPLRERGWRALVIALYRVGRQAEALEAIRELTQTLADGLGLDPSPEMRRLEEQILQQDPALQRPSEVHLIDPPRAEVEPPVPDRAVPSGILGRDAVLGRMAKAVASAGSGRGSLITVEGPAGIGKSTVLQSLSAQVSATGGLVLQGAGVGALALPALWPWVTMLRQVVAADADDKPRSVDSRAQVASTLALLDPAMAAESAPTAQWLAADSALLRTRLYREVLDLLASLVRDRLVLVMLDDVQWVDPDTLALFSLAIAELSERGVLFAVSSRSDEPANVQRLLSNLTGASRESVLRVPLRGLQVDAIAELLGQLTGQAADPGVAAAVAARTDGNPFFARELVQLLMSERRLDTAAAQSMLPESVREVLRRRLDRLPEQTLTLLTVAALAGRPVDIDLLRAVTGLGEDAVLDGCEAAVLAGLLGDDTTGGYALSHDLVRQTLEESLSPSRRVRLHARIGRAMCKPGTAPVALPREVVVEIAHQLVQADAAVPADEAVPYVIAAADDAMAGYAYARAEELLVVALRLAPRLTDASGAAALVQALQMRLRTMKLIIGSSRGPAEPGGTPGGAGSPDDVVLDPEDPATWWSAVALQVAAGENVRAAAAVERALDQPLGPSAFATVHFMRGMTCFVLGAPLAAEESFAITENLLQDDGKDVPTIFSLAGTAMAMRAVIAAIRGEAAVAEQLLARAGERAGDSVPHLLTVASCAAWCAAQQGDPAGARVAAEQCARIAEHLDGSFYDSLARTLLGWAAAMTGDRDGLQMVDDGYRDYVEHGMLYQATTMLVLRAEAHAHFGDESKARAVIREFHELAAVTRENTLGERLRALVDRLAGESPEPRAVMAR